MNIKQAKQSGWRIKSRWIKTTQPRTIMVYDVWYPSGNVAGTFTYTTLLNLLNGRIL